MKLIHAIFVCIALYATIVSAQISLPNTGLNVIETALNINLSQGQTKTAVMHISNTGAKPLELLFDISALDLIDNDGDRIALAFSDPGIISSGDQANVTITARADREIDFENYGGTLTVKDRNSTASDTLVLNIVVTPDICDFGEVPDDLGMEIENPDNGEEVEPSEDVNIRVNVMNNGRNDRRVQVEAFLFAESGRKIAEASSESKNIEDSEDEDFTLDMAIPTKSEAIGDVDDDFTLFVKAFDDDNERLACIQKSQMIDIELPSRKVIIDKASTRFFPSAVTCGETAIASIRLVNLGEKDSTVSLTLQSNELKIQKKLPNIRIESFNAEERNIATRQFEVEIPRSAQKKEYVFALRLEGDASASEDLRLSIIGCEEKAFLLRDLQTEGIMNVQKTQFKAMQGSTVIIPVELTNNLNKKASFTLSFRNVADFAVGTTKSVLLSAGQKTTMFMELSLREDIAPSAYTAILELATDEGPVTSEAVAITVESETPEEASLTDALKELPFSFWIVLNVVLLGLIILAVKIVTSLR